MKGSSVQRATLVIMTVLLLVVGSFGATVSSKRVSKSKTQITEKPSTRKKLSASSHSRPVARRVAGKRRAKRVRRRYYERFTASSFASNQTIGDITTGEDPVVRQAAIDALGDMNGTVVAIDPSSGRVLAMVNQKLALSEGAQPCSTIKISVALAALSEGIVTKDTKVNLGGWRMDMNQALAHSNNQYFEALGRKLGFEKVSYYAHQFGLGELAGWSIEGEHLGEYPVEPIPAKLGGVGKMCSFGEGISMTPLQLGALVSAIANGGTLYYLQHPTTSEEIANYQPKVKRYLDIAPLIPEVSVGMLGATQFGTARSLRANFFQEDVLGKTGTCSKDGTRFGWFASYANTQNGRIVTVFFLEGGRPTFGPKAAELAGKFYRSLYDGNYFAARPNPATAMQSNGTSNAVVATQ
jgi:penicillin-binding protein 2